MRRWLFRLFSLILILFVVAGAAIWLLEFYPRHGSHPPLQLARGTLAIEHAKIYTSPNDPAIDDGTVLVRDGLIAAVGNQVEVPSDATIVPCDHCVVTAGFWNAHVHFTEPKWSMANWKSAATLDPQLADMFLSRGFTTVIDLGSNPADTFSIRRRIEKGELTGPYIYTAGTPLYPPHGVPFYIRETAPKWIVATMPQPETPQDATRHRPPQPGLRRRPHQALHRLLGSRGHVLPMPVNIARAAVTESHLNGKLVFAHPSNLAGMQVAIDSGVDVLAHAADETKGVDAKLLSAAIAQKYGHDSHAQDVRFDRDHRFALHGSHLRRGAAVSSARRHTYLRNRRRLHDRLHDRGRIRASSAKAASTGEPCLAMLTTNPAARMGVSNSKGTVTPGKLADLTILDADPADALTNFSRVHAVVRSGKVIWQH